MIEAPTRRVARLSIGVLQCGLLLMLAAAVVCAVLSLGKQLDRAMLAPCLVTLFACGVSTALLSCVIAVYDIADDIRGLAGRGEPIGGDRPQLRVTRGQLDGHAKQLADKVAAEDLRRFQQGG